MSEIKQNTIGKKAAGRRFATLILVIFRRFKPIASTKIDPTQDSSVIICSVKNPAMNCAASVSAPS